MSWRTWTDRAKQSDFLLRVADRMGRGRGRLRLLDQIHRPTQPPKPDMTGWEASTLRALWIGHATVLLRIGGMNILTDPVLGNRVGIGFGLVTGGPRRLVAPALRLAELPPIDLILISHAHYDHLDRPTLNRLPKETPVVSASHTRDLIADLGFVRITELGWGDSLVVRGITLTARRVAHWGARTFVDLHRGYGAYLIQSSRHRVLYGGDTAYHEYFKDIDGVDLAILGIGGYNPYVKAHATPEQAWTMTQHMRARHLLPIHHGTFRLSHEPPEEPMQRLLAAAGPDAGRVAVRQIGGQWSAGN